MSRQTSLVVVSRVRYTRLLSIPVCILTQPLPLPTSTPTPESQEELKVSWRFAASFEPRTLEGLALCMESVLKLSFSSSADVSRVSSLSNLSIVWSSFSRILHSRLFSSVVASSLCSARDSGPSAVEASSTFSVLSSSRTHLGYSREFSRRSSSGLDSLASNETPARRTELAADHPVVLFFDRGLVGNRIFSSTCWQKSCLTAMLKLVFSQTIL